MCNRESWRNKEQRQTSLIVVRQLYSEGRKGEKGPEGTKTPELRMCI